MAVRTERMKEILDIRFENPEKEKELCIQMLSGECDKYTEAFGRTYLGDAYHSLGQADCALPECEMALALAEDEGYENLLSVLYNLLGIIYMYNDDEQSALDYFFDGIRLAEKMDDKMMHAALLSNIAYVYRDAGAYDKAEEMIDEISGMIRDARHNDANVEIEELDYDLDKIRMMLQKHETDAAWERMQKPAIQSDDSHDNYINFAIYYEQKGDKEQCSRYIDAALLNLENEINMYERIIYLLKLIEIAIYAHLYEKADEISHIAEELLEKIGTVGKWTKLMEYRIEIYEAQGRKQELEKAYEQYYEYDQIYEEEKRHAVITRVRRKIELLQEIDRKQEIEQKQAKLVDKRSLDELTRLYNRWGFKNKLKEMYRQYAGQGKTLALGILDIDFFKEYNDTYGHVAGDRVIKVVADTLYYNIEDSGIAGRYGGDEFLFAVYDKSGAQLKELFEGIKSELQAQKIDNEKSKVSEFVTITIGAIVTKFEKTMDFTYCIHEADKVLYEVKNNSKNGYMIKELW